MPKRIPIRVAQRVAEEYACKQVIIVAWDGSRTHVVTYGEDKEQCRQAAIGGTFVMDEIRRRDKETHLFAKGLTEVENG